ncbi:MAG TPA: hypothetical protein VMT29_08930 [Steroidobacteraceae bacterium]|nr:hypothetical protein [Steroidobacteraceae bacterium]
MSLRRLLAAIAATAGCSAAGAYEPSVSYMLQCMGCHTPDGRGEPGRVPSVRETLVPFASLPEGRRFLIQVPGAAQSTLSDAELADLLNWMIHNLSQDPPPKTLAPYTAAEVAGYRHTPLVNVRDTRAQLLAKVAAVNAQQGGSVSTRTPPPPQAGRK